MRAAGMAPKLANSLSIKSKLSRKGPSRWTIIGLRHAMCLSSGRARPDSRRRSSLRIAAYPSLLRKRNPYSGERRPGQADGCGCPEMRQPAEQE